MITSEYLEAIPAHSIFAAGILRDRTGGVYIGSVSGRLLRWVAVRGGVSDWAVYVGDIEDSFIDIQRTGDKVSLGTARVLVPCGQDARDRYRG